jgi:hypothetical protein
MEAQRKAMEQVTEAQGKAMLQITEAQGKAFEQMAFMAKELRELRELLTHPDGEVTPQPTSRRVLPRKRV